MTTSTQAVESHAKAALAKSPIPSLRDLNVEQTETGLLISGTVPTYYCKQLAQEAVMAVATRIQVINTVEVA